jgi:hypothetical protein
MALTPPKIIIQPLGNRIIQIDASILEDRDKKLLRHLHVNLLAQSSIPLTEESAQRWERIATHPSTIIY